MVPATTVYLVTAFIVNSVSLIKGSQKFTSKFLVKLLQSKPITFNQLLITNIRVLLFGV